MVDSIKSEVTQGIITGLGLAVGVDPLPTNIKSDVISPVFNVNERWVLKSIHTPLTTGSYFQMTVPKGKKIKILYGNLKWTASATVGNRTTRMIVLNPDNSSWSWAVQMANLAASSSQYLSLSPAASDIGTTGTYFCIPAPQEFIIPELHSFRYYDYASVDTTSDQWMVNLVYLEASMDL